MTIDHNEILRLTEEYGGQWGINHSRRLLQLIALIGEGQVYDQEAVWLAVHLHDWGAYAPWLQKDVDHALRSRQVADTFLNQRDCPAGLQALALECIELHHAAGADHSLEAILLRDADTLDFLGVVGVLRDFSKNARDLRKAYTSTRQRQAQLPGMLALDRAKEIAAQRVAQMDALLRSFEADSFGCF